MFPTFEGKVVKGKLVIEELGNGMRIFEGKHLAVTSLDLNDQNQVVGGKLKAGVYENGDLKILSGDTLDEFEGRNVFVSIRHQLIGTHEAFGEKFQLGAKIGDLDN